VTFVRDEDAKTAISGMHGTSLDGRNITVNEAQEKSPRGAGAAVSLLQSPAIKVISLSPMGYLYSRRMNNSSLR